MIGIGLYLKNSLEAVELYKEAFGFELGYHVMNTDGKGYFHSELVKDGEPQFCVAEAPEPPAGNPVQLGVDFQSREDLERAFSIFKGRRHSKDGVPRAALGTLGGRSGRPLWDRLVPLFAPAPSAGRFHPGEPPVSSADFGRGNSAAIVHSASSLHNVAKVFYQFLEKITNCIFTFPIFCTRIRLKSYIQHLSREAFDVCVQK